ncbi:MAG: leucyl aminopeptidase [Planctomycetota bacterium]|jgi:leucyl aminopeptidase
MRLVASPPTTLNASTPLLALLVDDARFTKLPGGALGERAVGLRRRGTFEGGARKTLLLHAEGARGPRALLLVGLGPAKKVGAEELRRAAAIVVNKASEMGLRSATLGFAGKLSPDASQLQAVAEGAAMAAYRYPGKKVDDNKPPASLKVASGVRGAASALRAGQVLGEASNLARELGDLPGNTATPRYLANAARKVCREGKLRCRVYGKAALKRMRMGGILAVNQGTSEEPFLVEMEYKPARYKTTLCVVGKGLTFDSGGISIKPSAAMDEMKYDMCGAGATIGLMRAVARLKPKGVRVIGIVGTTDNMPGPAAYKPGDVVKTANGKTIEVLNTDAEGRVVLADALHHATRFKPDAIVDMATLTGAIVISLGNEAAGLFCKDDKLSKRLVAASERTGERVWPMPTYPEYDELIKSRVADIKNTGGRGAGSCTAAQFLFHFTGDIPHAHIDIAGTAWNVRKRDYLGEGGTGFGVRLLYDAIANW